jgi:hypothetical protein
LIIQLALRKEGASVFRKVFTFFIISCFCIQAPTALAQSSQAQITKDARHAQKIKNVVFKSSVGPGNDIEVKLKDKTKINGYLSEVTDDYFVVTDPRTGAKSRFEYGQVEKVRVWLLEHDGLKRNFKSSGRIIRNAAIGFGIFVVALGVICMASRRCEN